MGWAVKNQDERLAKIEKWNQSKRDLMLNYTETKYLISKNAQRKSWKRVVHIDFSFYKSCNMEM